MKNNTKQDELLLISRYVDTRIFFSLLTSTTNMLNCLTGQNWVGFVNDLEAIAYLLQSRPQFE